MDVLELNKDIALYYCILIMTLKLAVDLVLLMDIHTRNKYNRGSKSLLKIKAYVYLTLLRFLCNNFAIYM